MNARPIAGLALALLAACGGDRACPNGRCGTIVFAATAEPVTLLPPLAEQAVERDIHDQIFLKLADIGAEGNTVGDAGFEPQLANRWSWRDSLTLLFHLDDRARWQDGRKVTAADVAFTYRAYTDSATASPHGESLTHIASVTAEDSATAVVRFRRRYPEMFYDAVYHMRILPAHLLERVPFAEWRTTAFGTEPVGSGPYRLRNWARGQSLELIADTTFFLGAAHLQRLIWRFTADLSTAVTQVVAGEADAIEVLVAPPNIERARQAEQLRLYQYAGSVYTVAILNLRRLALADAAVRRALVFGTDRARMAQNVFGEYAKVPPAPVPQAWSALWEGLDVPPFDTARADSLLAAAGWRDTNGDGVREKAGRRLELTVVVPATSAARRQYARLIQEAARARGIAITIEEVDPPTLQQRLRSGNFDIAIQSWANDPTPSSGIPGAWTTAGATNFGRYANPAFDREVARALAAPSADSAATAWRAAFRIMADDAPVIVLNAPDNVAAIHRRFEDVRLRPDSYWAYVRHWRIAPENLTDRDRAP
jgi:peptide/nickel transport system substrate-binding protein